MATCPACGHHLSSTWRVLDYQAPEPAPALEGVPPDELPDEPIVSRRARRAALAEGAALSAGGR